MRGKGAQRKRYGLRKKPALQSRMPCWVHA
jgi:hypothetical protein